MKSCWKCSAVLLDIPDKIPFRAVCEKCLADQHCCCNCRYYAPGRANDCMIPGTDPIVDREKFNFCEDFSPKLAGTASTKNNEALEKAKRLFGES